MGMPGTFSLPPEASDPYMHHGTCVTHVPWCMPGSLTSGSFGVDGKGKHSWRMRNPQCYVSGKRPISFFICSDLNVGYDIPTASLCTIFSNFCGECPYNQMQPFKVLDCKISWKIIKQFYKYVYHFHFLFISVIFIGISDNVFCQVEGTIDNIAAYFPVDNIAAYFPIVAFSERLLPHSWGPMR